MFEGSTIVTSAAAQFVVRCVLESAKVRLGLKRSVDRDHSIRGAAVLMETDVGAIEIKGAIGLVAGLGIE